MDATCHTLILLLHWLLRFILRSLQLLVQQYSFGTSNPILHYLGPGIIVVIQHGVFVTEQKIGLCRRHLCPRISCALPVSTKVHFGGRAMSELQRMHSAYNIITGPPVHPVTM